MNVGSINGYKIETIDAVRFWSSSHKCNKVKAIIAFSKDLDDANNNLRRVGYKNIMRKRSLAALGGLVNNPSMASVPYSTGADVWWKCLFQDVGVGSFVKWKLSTDIDGYWGRAYFRNGDYLLVNPGATINGVQSLTPNHIYQYQGVSLSGISLKDALPNLVDKGVYDPLSDVYNIASATELEEFFEWFDSDRWPDVIEWTES